MSERIAKSANPFSGTVVGVLVAVALASFIGVFALLGWSPELADKNRAGQHPYSKSALGFAGLIDLLARDGKTVTVSRLRSSLEYNDDLLILSIPPYGYHRATDFDENYISEPALYILPKWSGYPDRQKPSWQKETNLVDRARVTELLQRFDTGADIWRLRDPGPLETPFGQIKPSFEHQMQVIDSDSLEPIIERPGGALLSKLPGREVYILADPDVLNTFGLAKRENARFGLSMIEWLIPYDGAGITFDATLHGFERSENFLRAIFDMPFLGATLLALATMLMVGWASLFRARPPARETRALAFGKKALADSSAGLVTMAKRQSKFAPGYALLHRRALLRRLNLPRSLPDKELASTIDAIAKQRGMTVNWGAASEGLKTTEITPDALKDRARTIWRWRKEITDGN